MFSADAVVWMLEHVDGIFTVAMAVQEIIHKYLLIFSTMYNTLYIQWILFPYLYVESESYYLHYSSFVFEQITKIKTISTECFPTP